MKRSECAGELVMRERRGPLSASQLLALDAHLVSCSSCRLARQIGRDFDRNRVSEMDDAERVQRLILAARRSSNRRGSGWRRAGARGFRARTFLVAACFCLFGGIAAAALGWRHRLAVAAAAGQDALGAGVPPRYPTAAGAATAPAAPAFAASAFALDIPSKAPAIDAPRPVDWPSLVDSRQNADTSSVARSPGHDWTAGPAPAQGSRSAATAPPSPSNRASPDVESASGLLRAASDARRNGHRRAAMSLYRKLQLRYPDSAAAEMSYVPLGGLLLDGGDPQAALDQFTRYAEGSSRALRAEALYGMARALGALEDTTAEMHAWRRLLDEFPRCPYAGMARRRLAQLR